MVTKSFGVLSSFVHSFINYFSEPARDLGTLPGAGHIVVYKTDLSNSRESTEVSFLRLLGATSEAITKINLVYLLKACSDPLPLLLH